MDIKNKLSGAYSYLKDKTKLGIKVGLISLSLGGALTSCNSTDVSPYKNDPNIGIGTNAEMDQEAFHLGNFEDDFAKLLGEHGIGGMHGMECNWESGESFSFQGIDSSLVEVWCHDTKHHFGIKKTDKNGNYVYAYHINREDVVPKILSAKGANANLIEAQTSTERSEILRNLGGDISHGIKR